MRQSRKNGVFLVSVSAVSIGCATVIGIDKDYRDQAAGTSGGGPGAAGSANLQGSGGSLPSGLSGTGGAGGNATTGGALTVGGAATNGGATSSGGSGQAGGAANGGTNNIGGVSNTGGTIATGGKTSSGGSANTGGVVTTGSSIATGGKTSGGGSANTGGALATGGKTGSGGSANTGGVVATGGAKATGGNVGTGGAAAGASSTSIAPILGVQGASVSFASGASSQKIAISSVDPTRSFLVFGTQFNTTNSGYTEISGQITGATEITFARTATSGAPAVPIRYYVAQFQSGVSVQRGSTIVSATSTPATLGTAVDLTKSFPIITYRNSGTSYGNDDAVRAKLTSTTQLSLNTGLAAPNGVAEWQVISFDGATVQTGDLTFATGTTALTANLTNAVDAAKTWLLLSSQHSGVTGTAAEMLWSASLSSSTQVTLQRAGGGATGTLTYYAVSFNNGTTVQTGTSVVASASTSATSTLTTVDLQKAIAVADGIWQRQGTTAYTAANNPGFGTFVLDIASTTSLALTRGASGGTSQANANWSVINFN
jgi:hypothetical protein